MWVVHYGTKIRFAVADEKKAREYFDKNGESLTFVPLEDWQAFQRVASLLRD